MRDGQCGLVVAMATREVTDDGDIQVPAYVEDNLVSRLTERHLAVLHFDQFADNEPLDLIEAATVSEVHHQAVEGVQFLSDLFDKQNSTAHIDLVGCAEPVDYQYEIAAPCGALRHTGTQRACLAFIVR